jgi:hypothetical protein
MNATAVSPFWWGNGWERDGGEECGLAGWKLGGAVAGKPVQQVTFLGLRAGASSSKGTYWAWSDGLLKK